MKKIVLKHDLTTEETRVSRRSRHEITTLIEADPALAEGLLDAWIGDLTLLRDRAERARQGNTQVKV